VGPIRNRTRAHLVNDVKQGGVVVRSSYRWSIGFDSRRPNFEKIGGVVAACASVEIRQGLGTRRRIGRLQSSSREVAADALLRPRRRHLISLLLARLQVEQLICSK
jgi:hypothetical protein